MPRSQPSAACHRATERRSCSSPSPGSTRRPRPGLWESRPEHSRFGHSGLAAAFGLSLTSNASPQGSLDARASMFTNTPVGTVFDAIARTVGEGCSYQVDAVNAGQLVTVDVSNLDELRAIAKVVRAAGLAPGSPYAVIIRRPGQKPTVIQTVLSKEPDVEDNR